LNKLLKFILKTTVELLEQSDRVSTKLRSRVSEGIDSMGDRASDLRGRAGDLYGHKDHTIRNVIGFAAGVGVGVGVAMLCAPASGEAIRSSIGAKAKAMSNQVRDRFSPKVTGTGTDGI
jgi:hypothetical protein